MIASVIVSGKILDNIIHKKHTRVKDRFWWGTGGGQSFKKPAGTVLQNALFDKLISTPKS
jgi:hypothetical protein